MVPCTMEGLPKVSEDEFEEDFWLKLAQKAAASQSSQTDVDKANDDPKDGSPESSESQHDPTTSSDSDLKEGVETQATSNELPQVTLFHQLHGLEESFRCAICRDLFHIPVAVKPCHHSFCSECIRKCLSTYQRHRFTTVKTQSALKCPTCNASIDGGWEFAKCLMPNRSLEQAVVQYKLLRPTLKAALMSGNPIASSQIKALNQMQHLVTSDTAVLSPGKKRAKKRMVPYNSYNRKRMQQLCKQEGLSTEGSETELRNRHRSWCTKYNAECDSDYPRPVKELLKEFQREEAAQKRTAMKSTKEPWKGLYASVKNNSSKISTGNAKMDKEMKSNFNSMIQRLRDQKKQMKRMKQEESNPSAADGNDSSDDQEKPNLQAAEEDAKPSAEPDAASMAPAAAAAAAAAAETEEASPESADETNQTEDEEVVVVNTPPSVSRRQSARQHDAKLLLDEIADDDEEDLSPQSKKRRKSRRSMIGPWNCPACTFLNTKHTWSTAKCEICGTNRPPTSSEKA